MAALLGVRTREHSPLQRPSTPDLHSQGVTALFGHSLIPTIHFSPFPSLECESRDSYRRPLVCEKSTLGEGDSSHDITV